MVIIWIRKLQSLENVCRSCERDSLCDMMSFVVWICPSDSFDEMPFEVIPISLQNISIAFEHPLKETLITGIYEILFCPEMSSKKHRIINAQHSKYVYI